MNEHPHLFISGLPACGKSTFGHWLEENHGYKHYDFEKNQKTLLEKFPTQLFEFIDIRNPKKLIESLKENENPIVFNWGFPVSYIDVAASIAKELLPVWFFADPKFAEQKFEKRGDVSMLAFEKQMNDLSTHGTVLDSVFGANTIKTIDDSGVFLEPNIVFQKIKEFEQVSAHNERKRSS